MANRRLTIYLNDHLAGSVVILKLLAHLEVHAPGHIKPFASELRREVSADRAELEAIMKRLEVAKSLSRRATAWLTEKLAEIKLRLGKGARGKLQLLETLEVVAVGVEGKRALWLALGVAATAEVELQGPDYKNLVKRAEQQQRRLEQVRCSLAAQALGSSQ